MSDLQKLNYIDLFSGCGGLSLGLFNSNQWHGLFAVEKSPDAFQTLRFNLIDKNEHFSWPQWLAKSHHDINELLELHRENLTALRGKVDLVAGGPPCQGFSMAGRRIEDDQRNSLVISYLKFIELVQPKVILFENVKGFKVGFMREDETRGVPYSEVVLDFLRNLGYSDAKAEILNFSDFGVPQHRQRCIIVGTRNHSSSKFFSLLRNNVVEFLESKGLKATQSLEEAISDIQRKHGEDTSLDTPQFRAGRYSPKSDTSYQELMRGEVTGPPDSHRFAKHSPDVESKFSTIIKERLTSKEVRDRFETKKCSTKLLSPNTPTPTLTTLPDDYVHYCEPRILTVREYARIQSFPDWFEFKGKYTTGGPRRKIEVPRYSQIGNAIPPLFAEHAGQVLEEILRVR
ncbi:MAG: DNA cytosine methyltransferase [Synoicihabitans sp.]